MKYKVISCVKKTGFTSDFFSDGESSISTAEIDGVSLQDIILKNKKKPFDENKILKWSREILLILEGLHSQTEPVIYGNLSPAHIIISEDNIACLKSITFQKSPPGVTGYVPQEQKYGKARVQSDIYSLGIVMHYLLTGKEPSYYPVSLPSVASSHLQKIIAQALEKDAKNRFSSAEEMGTAIENLQARTPLYTKVLEEDKKSKQTSPIISGPLKGASVSHPSLPKKKQKSAPSQKKIRGPFHPPKSSDSKKYGSQASSGTDMDSSRVTAVFCLIVLLIGIIGAIVIVLPGYMEDRENYLSALELSEKGEYSKAISILNKLLEKKPNDKKVKVALVNTYKDLALFLAGHGDKEGALENCNNALAIIPENKEVIEEKSKILILLSVECLSKKDYEKALDYINQNLEIAPDDTMVISDKIAALRGRGDELFEDKKIEKALISYDSISPYNSVVAAEILYDRGKELLKKEDYKYAVLYLEKALINKPGSEDIKKVFVIACFKRGNQYLYYEDYGEAIEYYNKLLAIEPKHKEALKNREKALVKISNDVNDSDEIKVYERMLTLLAGKVKDYAHLWDKKEELSAAIVGFQVYYDQRTSCKGSIYKAFWTEWTCCLIATEQYEKAAEVSAEGLSYHPGYNGLILDRGISLYFIGDRPEAVNCFDRVLDSGFASVKAFVCKIAVLYIIKDYEKVLKIFHGLSEDSSFLSKETYMIKGDCLYKMKKYKEASACYDKALDYSDPVINDYILNKKGSAAGKSEEAQN